MDMEELTIVRAGYPIWRCIYLAPLLLQDCKPRHHGGASPQEKTTEISMDYGVIGVQIKLLPGSTAQQGVSWCARWGNEVVSSPQGLYFALPD